jgi:acylphosphatase
MASQRRLVHFSGNVQGVGFRYTAIRVAGSFDVSGYVRNLPDGRVEVVVEGTQEQIDSFLTALQERMGYYIRKMTQQLSEPLGEFSRFDIRF